MSETKEEKPREEDVVRSGLVPAIEVDEECRDSLLQIEPPEAATVSCGEIYTYTNEYGTQNVQAIDADVKVGWEFDDGNAIQCHYHSWGTNPAQVEHNYTDDAVGKVIKCDDGLYHSGYYTCNLTQPNGKSPEGEQYYSYTVNKLVSGAVWNYKKTEYTVTLYFPVRSSLQSVPACNKQNGDNKVYLDDTISGSGGDGEWSNGSTNLDITIDEEWITSGSRKYYYKTASYIPNILTSGIKLPYQVQDYTLTTDGKIILVYPGIFDSVDWKNRKEESSVEWQKYKDGSVVYETVTSQKDGFHLVKPSDETYEEFPGLGAWNFVGKCNGWTSEGSYVVDHQLTETLAKKSVSTEWSVFPSELSSTDKDELFTVAWQAVGDYYCKLLWDATQTIEKGGIQYNFNCCIVREPDGTDNHSFIGQKRDLQFSNGTECQKIRFCWSGNRNYHFTCKLVKEDGSEEESSSCGIWYLHNKKSEGAADYQKELADSIPKLDDKYYEDFSAVYSMFASANEGYEFIGIWVGENELDPEQLDDIYQSYEKEHTYGKLGLYASNRTPKEYVAKFRKITGLLMYDEDSGKLLYKSSE